MKMKKEKNENEQSTSKVVATSIKEYIRKNYPILILFVVSFIASAAISFVRIATSNTISSYNIDDYEIGQIADRTIYAQKSLAADYQNPVSVEKDEKITRKGFPITEEDYKKLKKMAESPAYIDYRAFADSVLYLMLLSALWFFLLSPVCLGRTPSFKEVMEDIIEEIVGDIQDEFDNEREDILPIGENVWLCDARVDLDDLNETIGSDFPTEEFDTLGGFVFDLFGKIPVKFEKVTWNRYDFIVQDMEGHKVNVIKVICRKGIKDKIE